MARLTGQARQNRISDALFSLDSCGGHAPSRACPERSRRVQAEQSSAAATGEGNRFATSEPRSSALPDKDKKVRFDDFELDYGRFQLCRCGSPVRLEGLPLQLLMFMVERRGQLVTREQISGELWSKDVFVDVEQGINTAVRKIRRALEDDADEPQYLQTVVGRGYRFVAPTAEEDASGQVPAAALPVSAEQR